MLGVLTYSLILTALILGALRRPAVAVAAVLCLYGLKQWGQDTSAFIAAHGQITNVVIGTTTLVAVILAAAKGRRLRRRVSGIEWLILTLYIYALASVAWAPDWSNSLQQWVKQGPYIVTVLLLAPLLLVNFNAARSALTWTAVVGGCLCAVALAFGHWGARGLLIYGDPAETETNPLALASMAGTVFIIAALSLTRVNRVSVRVAAGCCIPLAVAVILRSGSRGQLLAAAAGLLIAAPIASRPRDGRSVLSLAMAALVIMSLGAWASTLVQVDSDRWSKEQSQGQVNGRLENAASLLSAASSDPATAVFGLGNSGSFKVIGIYPHITPVEVLAEEGLPGIGVYLCVVLLTLVNAYRMSRAVQDRDLDSNTLAILTGLFLFELILSCKQGSLLSSVYVFAYAITIARMEGACKDWHGSTTPPLQGYRKVSKFSNLLQ